MIHQLKNIRQKIFDLLKRYDHLKDNDNKLIASVWKKQIGQDNLNKMTAYEFLEQYANGNIISGDSITRVRRKLQEDEIELRGNNYYLRVKLEKETRKEIHTL